MTASPLEIIRSCLTNDCWTESDGSFTKSFSQPEGNAIIRFVERNGTVIIEINSHRQQEDKRRRHSLMNYATKDVGELDFALRLLIDEATDSKFRDSFPPH